MCPAEGTAAGVAGSRLPSPHLSPGTGAFLPEAATPGPSFSLSLDAVCLGWRAGAAAPCPFLLPTWTARGHWVRSSHQRPDEQKRRPE